MSPRPSTPNDGAAKVNTERCKSHWQTVAIPFETCHRVLSYRENKRPCVEVQLSGATVPVNCNLAPSAASEGDAEVAGE